MKAKKLTYLLSRGAKVLGAVGKTTFFSSPFGAGMIDAWGRVTWLALAIAALSLTSCAAYQSTVASRSDSLSGYSKDGRGAGAAFTHTVTYR